MWPLEADPCRYHRSETHRSRERSSDQRNKPKDDMGHDSPPSEHPANNHGQLCVEAMTGAQGLSMDHATGPGSPHELRLRDGTRINVVALS